MSELDAQIARGDATEICLNALKWGEIQSYVDLFYLTHRGKADVQPVDPEQLPYIAENLRRAEQWQMQGKGGKAYGCYDRLANYFQEAGDVKTAIYFFEKCLRIADTLPEYGPECCANACIALGLAHMKLSIVEKSVEFYQMALKVAEDAEIKAQATKSRSLLMNALNSLAESQEKKGEFKEAGSLLSNVLEEAKAINDKKSEGRTYKAMARVHLSLAKKDGEGGESHLETAKKFGMQHLAISRQTGDSKSECDAHRTLASVFVALGDGSKAINSLESYLKVASESGEVQACQIANGTLGNALLNAGRVKDALPYFEEAFKLASEIGDRALIDSSRVAMGTAKGKMMLAGYMNVVQNPDISKVLAWKTRRDDPLAADVVAEK